MKTERLASGLRVLFIGFNPSLRSHESGFNYAGRSNRFYTILYHSGLTTRLFTPQESPLLLPEYGYGFTNIVARPTRRADELSREEYREGAILLRAKVETYRPKIACLVGKGVAQAFFGKAIRAFGFVESQLVESQIDEETRYFVAPATSGLVRMKLEEQVEAYRALAWEVVKHPWPMRDEGGDA